MCFYQLAKKQPKKQRKKLKNTFFSNFLKKFLYFINKILKIILILTTFKNDRENSQSRVYNMRGGAYEKS